MNALRQLAAAIMRGGGSMTSSQTARVPIDYLRTTPPADALVDAPKGDQTLTLVMGGSEITGLFRRRTDCRALERGLLCGRGLGDLVPPRAEVSHER